MLTRNEIHEEAAKDAEPIYAPGNDRAVFVYGYTRGFSRGAESQRIDDRELIEKLIRNIADYKEVLRFYADGFGKKLTDSMMGQFTPAIVDGGARAKAVLERNKNGG